MYESLTARFSGGEIAGKAGDDKLPQALVASIGAICVLPSLLNLVGVDFAANPAEPGFAEAGPQSSIELADAMHRAMAGSFTHTILEWSSVCVACMTVMLAFVHYRIHPNERVTMVVALALLGLPLSDELPANLDHRIFADGFFADHPVKSVKAYPDPTAVRESVHTDEAAQQDTVQALRGLGYIDQGFEFGEREAGSDQF